MKYTPNRTPTDRIDPASRHGWRYMLAVALLAVVAAFAMVLALSYPVVALTVGALATVGWTATRLFRRAYRTRRQLGHTRRVCVPKLGVCVEV